MATIITQVLTDDLDKTTTEDVLTCYVALGESAVEIDLSGDNEWNSKSSSQSTSRPAAETER